MSKKLCFLMCFVLVLALSGSVQAATPLDVNNGSFELDCDGVQIQREVPPSGCIMGWSASGQWAGAIIWCESPLYTGETKCNTTCPTDGEGFAWIQNGDQLTLKDLYFWQVTDNNYAANKQYTLLIDGLGGCDPNISLFYGTDPCDANEVGSKVFPLATTYACESWVFDHQVQAVISAGNPAVGQPIGIKITNPLSSAGYFYMDNVRLEWDWATSAYEPSPEDGAIDVARDVDLSWMPGAWVDKHRVYFSTSFADVDTRAEDANKGLYDVSSYTIPGDLQLGIEYFWAIDEVNTGYVQGVNEPPAPPDGVWPGDVWSFTVEGLAYNVYPADGAVDIPTSNLLLRWTAGTDADGHDVYFGSDEAAVEDATTSTTGIYRSPTQALADVNYLVELLEVGKSYYWRIDEVNVITVKGDVWSFTTGVFLIVDDFDSYADTTALQAVWSGKYDAVVKIEDVTDPAIDGKSMMFAYRNLGRTGGSTYWGAEANATTTDLEVGTNWTASGVEALVLNFYGAATNGQEVYTGYHINNDQMYVAVEDGSTKVGIVKYPDMNDIQKASWQEWNIDLQDPCLSDVNLADVVKFYIGFGGTEKTGQSDYGAGKKSGKYDTVWFDDIGLYPPRCLPSVTGIDTLHGLGDITEDCKTDYLDLDVMATDWLDSDSTTMTEPQDGNLTRFTSDPAQWVTGHIGSGALEFDGVDDYVHVDDPQLVGLTSMSITIWLKQTIDNRSSILNSREDTELGYTAAGLGIFTGSYGGPDGLAYDWPTIDWTFDAGLDVPYDGTWTFVAMVVDPTGCTLYMKPDSGVLQTGIRNEVPHPPLQQFSEYFEISRGNPVKDKGFFQGAMDDARIYDYNLSFSDINDLANKTAEPVPPPAYWYKLDETSGLTAADSGYGATIYIPVQSAANLTDPEAEGSRSVNFRDYALMADNWLDEFLWP